MANLSTIRKVPLIVYTTGNQTISGIKNFIIRPQVNGSGVLLNGEAYPLNNPSGFVTGVVVRPSETGVFYPRNNPSGFITGVDLSPYATAANLASTGLMLNTKIDNLSGYSNNTFATITNLETTGSNLNQKIDNLSGVSVLIYGDQTISGLKDFTTRPTVNTIPVALSGEAASNIEQFVKNDYGATLYKGQPVYVSGSNGNNILIQPASNSGDSTSSKTFGLLKQTLLNNEQGYVVTEGPLLNVDTSMATEGDPVWLGPTGNLIFGLANKPKAPQHLVSLGFVERAHQNQGKIFVKVQNGFELEELHNVRIVNEQNSDIIIYNSGSGLWLNSGVNFGSFAAANDLATTGAALQANIDSLSGVSVLISETGVFYPRSNPSGFITGVDLSNYYTNNNPSGFITGIDTSNFYTKNNPSGFITGVDLSNYYTKDNPSGFVTGAVVRPSETGVFYPRSNPSGFITSQNVVYTTGDQTISGSKTFSASRYIFSGANVILIDNTGISSGQWQFINRPTVNGTGILLSGEAYPTSNPSGFITGIDISSFYPSSNPSGFITNSSVSKIIDKFTASSNQPPATGFATLDTRNSILVLDYDDAVNESGTFVGMIPETAGAITGLRVRVLWSAATATGGNCRWGARFADLTSSGINAPFDLGTEVNSAANSVSGITTTADIVCSGTAGLMANEFYRLLVYRNSADTANDTMVGDAELISVTTYLI